MMTITGKNPIWTDGEHYVYVEIPVLEEGERHRTTFFTASIQDIEEIQQHRWRLIRNEVVTLEGDKLVPIMSVILHSTVDTRPVQKDENAMNFSRDNLRFGANTKANEILINNHFAYLTLPDAHLVTVDAEDVARVTQLYWKRYKVRGKNVVRSIYRDDDKWKKTDLSRYVLQYTGKKPISHVNGDPLDCRKTNLRIEQTSY